MTDAYLMDAECIHGEVWYECKTCEKELIERINRDEALRSIVPPEGYQDEDF